MTKTILLRLCLPAVLILALLAGSFLLTAHRFTDIMGFDGWYVEKAIQKGYVVRTYYAGVPFLPGSYPIAMNCGCLDETAEYSVDLDGDGVRELVCSVGMSAAQTGNVRVFRAEDGVIYAGEFPLRELGIMKDDSHRPCIDITYCPETGQAALCYNTVASAYPAMLVYLDLDQIRYEVWSYCERK